MIIQGLEFPDECPETCCYKGSFAQFGQSAICGRCPLFCCKPMPYYPDGEGGFCLIEPGGFCLIEPGGYRPDWLAEWHKFFQNGIKPQLILQKVPTKSDVILKARLTRLVRRIHNNAVNHGFWIGLANIPEKLALIHSEVSEALEDHRSGNLALKYDDADHKPVGFMSELADVVIRVLDLAGDIDPDEFVEALLSKMSYNETRPYKHGKRY